MTMALVDYLIARGGLPPRRGQAYDYVLALRFVPSKSARTIAERMRG
jgi:hypothetical protein